MATTDSGAIFKEREPSLIGIGHYDVTKPLTAWQPMPVIAIAPLFSDDLGCSYDSGGLPGEQDVDLPRWDRAWATVCISDTWEWEGPRSGEAPAGNFLPV